MPTRFGQPVLAEAFYLDAGVRTGTLGDHGSQWDNLTLEPYDSILENADEQIIRISFTDARLIMRGTSNNRVEFSQHFLDFGRIEFTETLDRAAPLILSPSAFDRRGRVTNPPADYTRFRNVFRDLTGPTPQLRIWFVIGTALILEVGSVETYKPILLADVEQGFRVQTVGANVVTRLADVEQEFSVDQLDTRLRSVGLIPHQQSFEVESVDAVIPAIERFGRFVEAITGQQTVNATATNIFYMIYPRIDTGDFQITQLTLVWQGANNYRVNIRIGRATDEWIENGILRFESAHGSVEIPNLPRGQSAITQVDVPGITPFIRDLIAGRAQTSELTVSFQTLEFRNGVEQEFTVGMVEARIVRTVTLDEVEQTFSVGTVGARLKSVGLLSHSQTFSVGTVDARKKIVAGLVPVEQTFNVSTVDARLSSVALTPYEQAFSVGEPSARISSVRLFRYRQRFDVSEVGARLRSVGVDSIEQTFDVSSVAAGVTPAVSLISYDQQFDVGEVGARLSSVGLNSYEQTFRVPPRVRWRFSSAGLNSYDQTFSVGQDVRWRFRSHALLPVEQTFNVESIDAILVLAVGLMPIDQAFSVGQDVRWRFRSVGVNSIEQTFGVGQDVRWRFRSHALLPVEQTFNVDTITLGLSAGLIPYEQSFSVDEVEARFRSVGVTPVNQTFTISTIESRFRSVGLNSYEQGFIVNQIFIGKSATLEQIVQESHLLRVHDLR